MADAIERGDFLDLRDELGDLLLQVVFHARMAEERGDFDFGAVVEAITAKLVRRHPHVFGEARDLSPESVKKLWDEIKQAEKAERRRERGTLDPEHDAPPRLLGGIARSLPALARADKLTRAAAKVGFDWPDTEQVFEKIREELREAEEAIADGDQARVEDEIGDLLFAVANLARHRGVDPERALRGTNAKFERRFAAVEDGLTASGKRLGEASLEEMDELWVGAKRAEAKGGRL